jgi:glycosyltransferase involved in cell wall biosynthesis
MPQQKDQKGNIPLEECPGVTIVVCAHNEEENIGDYLHALLEQDYPAFEVIVVDDESEDSTATILEQYARKYENLYHTFVPRGARVISSKKLALTIGIKAAHYDYILLTDADCRPEGRNWIREMMRGYTSESVEMVLGFGPYFENSSWLSRWISYDTLFSGLQYMGMARAGHPYMGVGRNMSYRRQTFFDNNGFQGLLNTCSGDDDLFVNKVVNSHRKSKKGGKNVNVVCNREALTWSVPKRAWKEWMHQKRRHLSVAPQYTLGNKIRLTLEPLTRGLFYALLVVGMIFGGNLARMVILSILVLRLLMQLVVINRATRKLNLRTYGLELIVYDVCLPVITLYVLLANKLQKRRIYYW